MRLTFRFIDRRAVAAIAQGDKYQQRFLNKLESVKVSCERLRDNGQLSSTYFMIHAFKKLLEGTYLRSNPRAFLWK